MSSDGWPSPAPSPWPGAYRDWGLGGTGGSGLRTSGGCSAVVGNHYPLQHPQTRGGSSAKVTCAYWLGFLSAWAMGLLGSITPPHWVGGGGQEHSFRSSEGGGLVDRHSAVGANSRP